MSTYAGEQEFGRVGTPGFLRGWLDAILAAELHTNVEAYLYVGLFVVAIALRFTDLGARALHHDESLHAYFSYGLSTGKGYLHDPLMHGPFLFHITALIYLLFGASDATSRFAPALFGSALVLMPLLLRPWMGRVGAVAAAAFIAFSPSLLYYSRFIRNEAWVAVLDARADHRDLPLPFHAKGTVPLHGRRDADAGVRLERDGIHDLCDRAALPERVTGC